MLMQSLSNLGQTVEQGGRGGGGVEVAASSGWQCACPSQRFALEKRVNPYDSPPPNV
jgi:hypothetical protein